MERSARDNLENLNSECGVIASLIQKPALYYFAEELQPSHFSDPENRMVYTALMMLAKKGVETVDAYIILEVLNSSDATRHFCKSLTVEGLNDLVYTTETLARSTPEEYKILTNNVMDMAFRRDMFDKLNECMEAVLRDPPEDVQQKIYKEIDDVMAEYSSLDEVTPYGNLVDGCWEEIQDRQKDGYAGIPFKFPTLNEFVTMEKGELIVFGAGPKQGKSIMLLNHAVDLLRKDLAVLYIDSELNTRLFTARLLAHLSGVEYKRLTSGNYDEEEKERIEDAIAWLKTRRFVHIYLPMFDQQTVYTTVKKMSHTMGLDCLVVDYFKGSADGDAWDSYAELGRFVDMVKNQIAGKMGIYALAAAQATESGKLADSAKIARNASTIIMITEKTEEEMDEDGPECGNKKLRVIFNRNGMQHAPGEYIDVVFDGNHILYEEAKQHSPHEPF